MLKEQKKRKRYKHSGFDGTTLICCAIGVVVSVNSCNFVNEKIASAREAAKRAQVRIQSQSIQTEELVIPDSLDEIQQKLLGNKQEIALQENKESEDSYNAEYEAELATEPAESEDSYNEEVGNEILEETAESQTKADTMTESEIEKENLFLYPVRIPKVITNYFVRLLMQRQAIKQRNSKLQQQLQFLTELEAQSFPIQ